MCLCVWIVDILTSTLASQKSSKPEEIVEDLPHSDSEGAASCVSTGTPHQIHSPENTLLQQSVLPSVNLPSLPPTSPIPGYFPFPPSDCQLSAGDTGLIPDSARQSVLRCPTSLGYSCSPGVQSHLGPAASPGTSLSAAGTPGTPLTWDNYTESPTFSLSTTWSAPGGHSVWSDLAAVRQSIASSTDPFLIDSSETDQIEGIEKLRSDEEPVRKVQLVSTDCSTLSRSPLSSGRLDSETTEFNIQSDSEVEVEMDQSRANKLLQDYQELLDEIGDLDPASISKDTALQLRQEVNRIWDLKNAFRNGVRELVAVLPSIDETRLKWEKSCKEVVDKVIRHKMQVLAAIERVCPTEQMTEFQRKTLELQEKAMQESRAVRVEQEQSAKKVAWAEARVRLDTFRDQYNILVSELALDQTEVKDRDDVTISQNMQDLQSWKKTFDKITTNYREYVRIVSAHGEEDPDEGELASAGDEFEAVKTSFEEIKESLETVDRSRELFSTHKSTGEKLDYPHFSGATSEDYVKFKDKIVKAFKRNGVAKSEQVDKLRKLLSGFALSLVPESTESIDKAFDSLKSAFGDPRKVLEDRMSKLKAVGDLPPERLANEKPGFNF